MQILCLGDSITDCNHLFEDFPLGNGYVQLLAEKLPCNVQIKNHGIDGFTVSRILENIQTHRISLSSQSDYHSAGRYQRYSD